MDYLYDPPTCLYPYAPTPNRYPYSKTNYRMHPASPITVIIADAYTITRNGLAKTLESIQEIQVIAITSCSKELVSFCDHYQPDIIMVSSNMTCINNMQPYRNIMTAFPGIHVIIMAGDNDAETMIAMKTLGEFAWLHKSATEEKIVTTILGVHEGTYIKELYNGYGNNATKRELLDTLTVKEKEMLDLFGADLTAKEIAAIQHLSPRTIEGHKEKLKEKLHVKGSGGLAIYALLYNTYLPTLLYWVMALLAGDTPDAIIADITA